MPLSKEFDLARSTVRRTRHSHERLVWPVAGLLITLLSLMLWGLVLWLAAQLV